MPTLLHSGEQHKIVEFMKTRYICNPPEGMNVSVRAG
jgi:hypothetical protein